MYTGLKKRKAKDVTMGTNIGYSNKRLRKNVNNSNNNDDNEEEEEEYDDDLPQIINNDLIYRVENHIYFRSQVTTSSISTLCKLINEANNEFIILEKNIKHAKLTPAPLYVHITSDGGTLIAGFMAYDEIENSRIPIYTIIEGYAFSAATIMSMAGRKRYMTRSSYMLIHQLSAGCEGNFEQIKDSYINNEQLMKHLKEIYAQKTKNKLKGKKLDDILKRDIYIGADSCLKMGLVDEIYQTSQVDVLDSE